MRVYLRVVNSVLITIMCLNSSVAAAISTFDTRYEFLFCIARVLIPCNFKVVGTNTLFPNNTCTLLCFYFLFSMYSVLIFAFSFLDCLMSCIAELFR